MLIFYENGHYDTHYLTTSCRGIMNKGCRPKLVLITADEIIDAMDKHETVAEDEKLVNHIIANIVPSVDASGNVMCLFENKRQLMEKKSSIESMIRVITDKYIRKMY